MDRAASLSQLTPSEPLMSSEIDAYGALLRDRMEQSFLPPAAPTIGRKLTTAGVPLRHHGSTFTTFVTARAKAAFFVAMEWAESTRLDSGFALIGPAGTGKTHLLVAAARRRIEGGDARVRFINVPILLDRLRSSMRFKDHPVEDEFEYLCSRASVVVLDDLGKEKATDWAAERLYVLVESRYGRMLSTLASSNRTLEELEASGYGAIVSRLQETGPVVDLTGKPDFRPAIGSR